MRKQMIALIAAAALALPVAAQTAGVANDEPMKVQDFAVFVDPPTGFVFVKMPVGWKFVGKVDRATVAALPASVLTTLLPASETESMDVARQMPQNGKHPG